MDTFADAYISTVQGAVWSCVLNEEAVVAATASADFSTRLWNALTGDEVLQFQHSHIARTVAFARRSPRLLSAGAAHCFSVTWTLCWKMQGLEPNNMC